MKIHNVEQGSQEWLQARAGVMTASCFDKIITAGGAESTQAEAYENRLVAELLTGKPIQDFEGNEHTERGNAFEEDAADFYAMNNDVELVKVGFVTNDEGTIGCSPDRLIGDDGLLEIKVPAPHTHVMYLLGKPIDKKYMPQLQGQLWVTGRQWVDIISYHPEMKPVVIRVKRDPGFIAVMERLVNKSALSIQSKLEKLKGE